MITYTKNNIVHVDPEITEQQVMIYVGSPSHTVTPYDVYARYVVKAARIAFMRRQVPAEIHTCHRRIASIHHGSGPNGSVRFGDDMIPPDIYAVVDRKDEQRAIEALQHFSFRRHLHKPVSVIGNLWYNKTAPLAGTPSWSHTQGAWITGGTWPYVVDNALFIAQSLGLDTTKLEEYRNKRRAQRQQEITTWIRNTESRPRPSSTSPDSSGGSDRQ
jgi:hypothetical protein